MASAVLASHNESSYMGKFPYSNPHLNPNPNSTPNSKSFPAKRKITADHNQINGRYVDEYAVDVSQSVPDDASSFNHRRSYNLGADGDQFNQGEYISFDIASFRRNELVQLKKRFNAELDQIRLLKGRIESGEFQRHSMMNKEKKNFSKKSSTEPKRLQPGVTGSSNKESKRFSLSENDKTLMKMCRQVLGKLMNHKRCYVFNVPVDVIKLGLHDYHQIVKQPMDLGTVRMKLGKNMYETPPDFASDVRLTFENAMLYNPKDHEVHKLAGQLLSRFDDLFRPIHVKCPLNQPQQQHQQQWGCSIVEDLQESSWNQTSKPEKIKKSNMVDIAKKPDRMSVQETVPYRSSSNPPLPQSPMRTPPSPRRASPVKSLTKTKLPKPKAKDPNKREMSTMEKHKLGVGLQSLPDEKMPQVVHIIKKRNQHLADEGDEIELDIEVLDTETLWELDRFVTNWKKLVSKINRQALMGNTGATMDGGMVFTNAVPNNAMPAKKAKKGADGGDDDVDIGDDIPMSSFPPVEIEKDDGNGHGTSSSSSSSGSSSSSSSSSDSDSGSSSGSDSDADNAQSKDFSRT